MVPAATVDLAPGRRAALLRRALRLEYLTVGWNIVEGLVAIAAALASGSVALLGFGVDSFVESASGAVLIWRLQAERRATSHERVEHVERRAQQLVAGSLALLAVYVAWDATTSLLAGERPEPSGVGIALALASLVVMWWLARAKHRVGIALGSRAMTADAFQTNACFWLSVTLLVGIGLNAVFGWWWADPVAALVMVVFIAREARSAWRGEECAC
jgi:divalent metal cation (Fe/Co/Zn/Cd) transporter